MASDDTATTTVQVVQDLAAPPQRVFNAWLEPAPAAQWLFATPAGENVLTEIDARVGGAFTVVDRRNGQDVEHRGEYLQIEPPQRLAFSFSVPRVSSRATRVDVEIAAGPDGGCSLTLRHAGVPAEMAARDEEGWAAMLKRLAAVLATP